MSTAVSPDGYGFVGSAKSLAISLAGIVPGVQNVASAYSLAKDYGRFLGDAKRAARFRQGEPSVAVAKSFKREEIAASIETFPLSSNSKTRLLDAATFLLDVYVRRVSRA